MELDPFDRWLIAGLLVDRYGQQAPMIALRRAADAVAVNDAAGFDTWCAVASATARFLPDQSDGDAAQIDASRIEGD